MIVTIHQPDFSPWLGYFHRWAISDLYIVLDDVQFLRRGWQHRDRIKTADGPRWLTVPVLKKGKYEQRINEAYIDNTTNWRARHLGSITQAYSRCPGYSSLFPELKRIYGAGHNLLKDFNLDLLRLFADLLGIDTPVVMASESPSTLSSTARLVELTAIHGGTHYLTGTGSRAYLEEELFESKGITVDWQDFEHPVYPQKHGEFEPGMSVIDYLMNVRIDEADPL